MNIRFQICGLIILLLIFIFYKSHKTLKLYKEQLFYRALCIIIVSALLDILSLCAIYYTESLPLILVRLICKCYVITLIWAAYAALVYVLADLCPKKDHRKIDYKISIFTLMASLVTFLFPIHIYNQGNQIYTYGHAVICVYILVAIYIVTTLILAGALYKRLNPRRAFAVIMWMVIWIMSAVIQFFNNSLLIVGFASSIGVLILFAIMENPEVYHERRLGCFNSYALTEYLKAMLEDQTRVSVLDISFENSDVLEDQGLDAYEVLQKILRLIHPYQDIRVFKNISYGLMLISKNEDSLKAAGEKIIEKFCCTDTFRKNTKLILAPLTDDFGDVYEFSHFISHIRSEHIENIGQIFTADHEMIKEYKDHYLVQQEITCALAEDRVEVFLQPIYSNKKKCFISAEALVRIRKKNGKLIAPGTFIPIAEDSGQILELGERVIEKVCQFLKENDIQQYGLCYIEVNLSVIQCENSDLADKLISIIEKYDVDPGLINFEITETASISARAKLLENMKELIDYGFSFSLDDFGKGESNLMYVVEMPVSTVKLDYDMSKAFFMSPKAKHVVRAVVNMAHDMDLKLVAEGIETEEEQQGMNQEGIDYIQGFYYSRPLPMDEFIEFLKNFKKGKRKEKNVRE